MIETSKKILLLFGLLKSSEAFSLQDAISNVFDVAPEHECILSQWSEWVEQGTCALVTRKRSYNYYMSEYTILQKKTAF